MKEKRTLKGAMKYLRVAATGTLLASIGSAYTFDNVAHASSGDGSSDTPTEQVSEMYGSIAALSSIKFKDVRADYWAADSIKWGAESGIIHGYKDGTFRTGELLTESQFAAILTRYFPELKEEAAKYAHLDSSNFSNSTYEALSRYKAPLMGYKSSFYRNAPVQRGVIAQVISNLQGNSHDLNVSVKYLFDSGITVGMNDSSNLLVKYGYKENLTRVQAVVFFHRMHELGKTSLPQNVKDLKVNIGLSNDPAVKKTIDDLKTAGSAKVDASVKPKDPNGSVVKPPVVKPPVVKPPVVKPPVVKPPVKPPVVTPPSGSSVHKGALEVIYGKGNVAVQTNSTGTSSYTINYNGKKEVIFIDGKNGSQLNIVAFNDKDAIARASNAVSKVSGKATPVQVKTLINDYIASNKKEMSRHGLNVGFDGRGIIVVIK